jgi:hypothetical protein
VIQRIPRLFHLLYLASGCLNANHLTGVVSGITNPLPSLLDTRGDAASASRICEIASALQQPGVSGPGTGSSSYVPYVFRRTGLSFEMLSFE